MLKPRHAILPSGMSLHRDSIPYQFAESVGGGFAHARFMDDGKTYTAGKAQPAVGPQHSGIVLPLELRTVTAKGEAVAPFVVDATIAKARVYRAGSSVLQQVDYPLCIRNRSSFRVKAGEVYSAVEVCIPNVRGFGSQYNVSRQWQPWDGRIAGILPDGRWLHVYVEDAKEKFPRGYRFENGNLYLTLHTNLLPKDESKAGVHDLMAFHSGDLSCPLPKGYAELLTSDPLISQCAQEVNAQAQVEYAKTAEFCIGMDFWLSIGEPVDPQPPLVLLDGFESPIWSKIKPGIGNDDLRDMERRLLELSMGWLHDGPRGSLLYGDFSEAPQAQGVPNSYYRCRGAGFHYFAPLEAIRSFLQFGGRTRYTLAKAFHEHVRDHVWRDGQATLYKSLLPWACGTTVTGHWADSESLLFWWLVDGDYHSLAEYERWMKLAASAPQPTRNDRESCVFARQCRVAHWYTGDVKWKQWADTIEQRALTQPIGEGALFHPLWTDKVLPGTADNHEGALNVTGLVSVGQLERVSSFILHGQWPVSGNRIGPGLLGEGYVGLQRERIYDYFRPRKLACKHRVVYGTSKDLWVRVFVEKPDDAPRTLRIALASRKAGDLPQSTVDVIAPNGTKRTFTCPAPGTPQSFLDGWPVKVTEIPFEGKAGRYRVEFSGHEYQMVHGPMSTGVEWQDCGAAEWAYPGQDANGEFPIGSVLVGQ